MPSCPSSRVSYWVQSGSFWGRYGSGPSREEAPVSRSTGSSAQPFPLGRYEESTAVFQVRGVLRQSRHVFALCRPLLGSEKHLSARFKKKKKVQRCLDYKPPLLQMSNHPFNFTQRIHIFAFPCFIFPSSVCNAFGERAKFCGAPCLCSFEGLLSDKHLA